MGRKIDQYDDDRIVVGQKDSLPVSGTIEGMFEFQNDEGKDMFGLKLDGARLIFASVPQVMRLGRRAKVGNSDDLVGFTVECRWNESIPYKNKKGEEKTTAGRDFYPVGAPAVTTPKAPTQDPDDIPF